MSARKHIKHLLSKDTPKDLAFSSIAQALDKLGFSVTEVNNSRPWGGYLLIDVSQTDQFLETFFSNIELPVWLKDKFLSPKIMLWSPGEILSWQYHNRREEYWKVVKGPVLAYLSENDEQPHEAIIYHEDRIIEIPRGIRHRGAGHHDWGIIAEIWGHTDQENLSTEEDIVRLDDKYKR